MQQILGGLLISAIAMRICELVKNVRIQHWLLLCLHRPAPQKYLTK